MYSTEKKYQSVEVNMPSTKLFPSTPSRTFLTFSRQPRPADLKATGRLVSRLRVYKKPQKYRQRTPMSRVVIHTRYQNLNPFPLTPPLSLSQTRPDLLNLAARYAVSPALPSLVSVVSHHGAVMR